MIGLVRFDFRGGSAEASLGNDGCWNCAAVPCLARPLDILFSPNREGRPAGQQHLEEAARWLKGVVFGADGPVPGVLRPQEPVKGSESSTGHATTRRPASRGDPIG